MDLSVVQRDSIPCLKSYSPALWLGDRLDFFGDVFRSMVDMDAVELGPIARDPFWLFGDAMISTSAK